jgi:BON domain
MSTLPSIHIIVNNGNVTLEGVADSKSHKNLANLRASSVPNVFSVTDNLVAVTKRRNKVRLPDFINLSRLLAFNAFAVCQRHDFSRRGFVAAKIRTE